MYYNSAKDFIILDSGEIILLTFIFNSSINPTENMNYRKEKLFFSYRVI